MCTYCLRYIRDHGLGIAIGYSYDFGDKCKIISINLEYIYVVDTAGPLI